MNYEEGTQTSSLQLDDWQVAHPWIAISSSDDSPDEVICYSLDEIRY